MGWCGPRAGVHAPDIDGPAPDQGPEVRRRFVERQRPSRAQAGSGQMGQEASQGIRGAFAESDGPLKWAGPFAQMPPWRWWGGPPGPRGTPPSRCRNYDISIMQGARRPTGASAADQGVRPTNPGVTVSK